MRKAIILYLYFGLLVNIGLLISCFINANPFHNWSLMITTGLIMIMALFTLVLGIIMSQSGLDSRWFKTQDELNEAVAKARTSWNKADKFMLVIGEHEAIKLWKEKQKEDERKETKTD